MHSICRHMYDTAAQLHRLYTPAEAGSLQLVAGCSVTQQSWKCIGLYLLTECLWQLLDQAGRMYNFSGTCHHATLLGNCTGRTLQHSTNKRWPFCRTCVARPTPPQVMAILIVRMHLAKGAVLQGDQSGGKCTVLPAREP